MNSSELTIYYTILNTMERLNISLTRENIYSAVWLVREQIVKPTKEFSLFAYNVPIETQIHSILNKGFNINIIETQSLNN